MFSWGQEHYFCYGALVFARSIPAKEISGKEYAPGFSDKNYEPLPGARYSYISQAKNTYRDGVIQTTLLNQKTRQAEAVTLIPLGKAILRQVTFAPAP